MKKYYRFENSKILVMLDWDEGDGTIDKAREHLGDNDVIEITKEEFEILNKEYSK